MTHSSLFKYILPLNKSIYTQSLDTIKHFCLLKKWTLAQSLNKELEAFIKNQFFNNFCLYMYVMEIISIQTIWH